MPQQEKNLAMAVEIARQVAKSGGRAYFVGGYVRDGLLGQATKDIDMEIHGLPCPALEKILDSLGHRMSIGEHFGIFALKGYALDIAMPRTEEATGRGHRDFTVSVDPFIGAEAACRRRDFTINAMMRDVLTGELIDPFGGEADLRRGVLRHVWDASFGEDPLRVLRCAQFAARFSFDVAQKTLALCQKMDLSALPRERIWGELEKALLKAEHPSRFFEILRQMEQLDVWFPEPKALIGIPQNPRYHGEGDVWNHTMLVLDEAAKLRDRAEHPLWLLLGALTHDFGKALSTEEINGVFHAYGHAAAGLPLAEAFLRRLTRENACIATVLNLTELHMKPNVMACANSSPKATNHLFDSAKDPQGLICLALADDRGRICQESREDGALWLEQRLTLYRETMAHPHVTGQDLIDAGLTPGADFSAILKYAHKLRLAGVPKESALKQTLAFARQHPGKKP